MPEPVPPSRQRLQAACAAWHGRGVLVQGRSGAGKSALLMQLLAGGAWLVADDAVTLERRRDVVLAVPGDQSALVEMRGGGIWAAPTATGPVALALSVRVDADPARDRLPEERMDNFLGVDVPLLQLPGAGAAGVAQVLLGLFGERRA